MSHTTTPDRAVPIWRMAAICGSCGDERLPCKVCEALMCACPEYTSYEQEHGIHHGCMGIHISQLEARIRDLERYEKLGHDMEMAIQRRLGKRLVHP